MNSIDICTETEEQAAEIRRKRFEALVEEAAAEGIPEIAAKIRIDRPKPKEEDLSDVFTKRTRTRKPAKRG